MLDLRDVPHTVLRDVPKSIRFPEDGYAIAPNKSLVVDAYSALYHPEKGATLFQGLSSGQVVRDLVLETVQTEPRTSRQQPLIQALLFGNAAIRRFFQEQGFSNLAAALPGAAFAGFELRKNVRSGNMWLEGIQGSDALAIWRTPQGIGFTPDQAWRHEEYLNGEFELAVARNQHTPNPIHAAWTERFPDIQRHRNQWTNLPGGYASLNGDPAIENLWKPFAIPLAQLPVSVIILSDGLIRYQGSTAYMGQLASHLFQQYDKGGLKAILAATRTLEQARAGRSHETFAEATAIAFEF